jgi:hypothetical protein
VKTHTIAFSEGPQGVNSCPESVGSLGHQHEVLALHLDHKLARGLRANPFQKTAGSSRRIRTSGFCYADPLWERLLHLGARGSGADSRAAHWPGHVIGCPERGAPLFCFLRSNRYRQRTSTLGCELGRPTWLVECGGVRDQVYARSGAHRDVLLSSEGLCFWGSSAGRLQVPPSFTLSTGPVFLVGTVAKESTPAFAALTGRPATTPAYTALTSA